MALMDSRSSEALARRASVSMLGETAKRLPLRGFGLSLEGAKWWSRARSAASWNFFESLDS